MKELNNLIDAINKSDSHTYPYEHFYATNIFSDNFYNEILDNLPTDEDYFHFMHPDCILDAQNKISARLRYILDSTTTGNIAGVWSKVHDIFHSEELKEVLFNRFKETARKVLCSPQISLMRDKKNYKILPHPDSPIKIITFQMYLPHDNSRGNAGTIINTKEGNEFKKYKQFKFHRNSCYAFPVGKNSWHSVGELEYEDFDRNSLMALYYKDGRAPTNKNPNNSDY